MATLSSTNTEQLNLQAISFVVRAFNEMNEQFNKKLLSGENDGSDPFLSKLSVKKAYQSPEVLYSQHLSQIQEGIIETIQDNKINFSNMSDFKPIFIDLITKVSKKIPITYPGFVKSSRCPMNVSGLVIEIADIDYANDENKILAFKNSPNWKFYLNACRSYGFYVDSSNPFRLVANIGSPEMLEYARSTSRCAFTSPYSIFSRAYLPAYLNYDSTLRQFIFDTYIAAKATYLEIEHCLDGTTNTKVIEPTEHTLNEMPHLFNDLEFLMLYMKLRCNEGSVNFKDYEKDRLYKNTIQKYRKDGMNSALGYFSKFINNTFNYNGSLTDRVNRATIIRNEEQDVLSNT